ncbi:NADH-ubiquinone oxidoreductase 78 kDa subunit [Rhizoctonia solani]|uniref:NADH-ubiquinone oxidoreductase 78 kDa subunit n=1 Tax=Rhizoctonia solani TaxID=456999 RepID=A0A8H8P772_9AGAM|nr:NADH-ubiquinone oxidoreductase 78 kDa subunit [Rhizoctonia solani]QRW25983.1 NADH-ubiquinone oxidoreductase 78 kDa subunit [Rhizoctonia solani]
MLRVASSLAEVRGLSPKVIYLIDMPVSYLQSAISVARRTFASSSARRQDITLTVDGKEVTVPQGSALIQACEAAGSNVPRFCYHDRLAIAGNCRMCLVEVERSPKPVASCAMPAMPGQKVFTNTPAVHEAREGVMEFLLANHPLDCPICDQGGECDLQDQSMRYGSDRARSMKSLIGMYVEKVLNSELSGNIVDLCPVGALTSKPYAFHARPWELKNTESVDVLDAVMRIQPRTNDDVNEWISDKTRYAYDGLRTQRLTTPLIRQGDRFVSASWEEALHTIADGLKTSGAQADEIQAVAGALADTEALVALKDLVNRLGSDNLVTDATSTGVPSHSIDVRSNYLFNSTIQGLSEADAILLRWLHAQVEVGLIGEEADLSYSHEWLGKDSAALENFLGGKADSEFAKVWANAKKPLIVVGSAVAESPAGSQVLATIARYASSDKQKTRFLSEEWNGLNVLQRAASRAAAYDVGYAAASSSGTTPKFIYLLNADDVSPSSIPQIGRAAVPPPGASREDWKIIRALSEVVQAPLPYDDVLALRDRMWDISPTLVRYDVAEKTSTGVAQNKVPTITKIDPFTPSLFPTQITPESGHAIFWKGEESEAVNGREQNVVTGGILGGGSSGIGEAIQLSDLGIQVVGDLTGVGKNYEDHPLCLWAYHVSEDVETCDPLMEQQPEVMERYQAEFQRGKGMFTTSLKGSIHITGTDPYLLPKFRTGLLEEQADVEIQKWAYKKARECARRMRSYRGEYAPLHPKFPKDSAAACIRLDGPPPLVEEDLIYTPEDDAAIESFVRQMSQSTFHSGGALTPVERVWNNKLEVADLSILPSNVGSPTYSIALMIGEKALF